MRRHVAYQQTLADQPTGRRRKYCRRCGKELTAALSRSKGYGPDCDPVNRAPAAPEYHVDQDAIPGT
jgi:hypothetical protein